MNNEIFWSYKRKRDRYLASAFLFSLFCIFILSPVYSNFAIENKLLNYMMPVIVPIIIWAAAVLKWQSLTCPNCNNKFYGPLMKKWKFKFDDLKRCNSCGFSEEL